MKAWQGYQASEQQKVENVRADEMMGLKEREASLAERRFDEYDIPELAQKGLLSAARIEQMVAEGLLTRARANQLIQLLPAQKRTADAGATVAEADADVAVGTAETELEILKASLRAKMIANGVDARTADARVATLQFGPDKAQADIDLIKARTEETTESGKRAWDASAQGWQSLGLRSEELELKKADFARNSKLIDAKISSLLGVQGAKAQAFVDDLYKQIETTASKLSGTIDAYGNFMEVDEKGKLVLKKRLKNLEKVMEAISGEKIITSEQMEGEYLRVVGEAFGGATAEAPVVIGDQNTAQMLAAARVAAERLAEQKAGGPTATSVAKPLKADSSKPIHAQGAQTVGSDAYFDELEKKMSREIERGIEIFMRKEAKKPIHEQDAKTVGSDAYFDALEKKMSREIERGIEIFMRKEAKRKAKAGG
jgi:hypothetical protein